MSEGVIEGVVDNPDLGDDQPSRSSQLKNVLPGEFLPVDEYDALKEKGRILGTNAGELAWTQNGRKEIESTLDKIHNSLKVMGGRLFGGKVTNEQVLYEVSSGLMSSADPELNQKRISLNRVRSLINEQSPMVSEDNFRGTNFQRSVLEKGIRDGWQTVLDESPYKNETNNERPWYLQKVEAQSPIIGVRQVR